jgi:ABC-type transporter Mla subunit MlaD
MTDVPRPGATPPQDSAISGLVDRAQGLASSVASNAQDKVRRLAEEQKTAAAEQVEDVARVLDSAAEQVERVLPEAAHYVREAASGVHRVSSAVRDQSIDEIIDTVTTFARTRPGTFFAGSAALGFALARFLKASAERRIEMNAAGTRPTRSSAQSGSRARSERSASRGSGAGDPMTNAEAPAAAGADRSR